MAAYYSEQDLEGRIPYQEFSVTLSSGESFEIYIFGNKVQVLDNTGSQDVQLSVDNGPAFDFPEGVSVDMGLGAHKLRFTRPGGTAGTIAVAVGVNFDDNRKTLLGSVNTKSGSSVQTPAAASVTDAAADIIAATTNRTLLLLQNVGANTVWIGDANIDPAANRGVQLAAGASLTLAVDGLVQGRCAAGLTSTVSILEIIE